MSKKSIKYKQFRCNFEDKNGQTKGIIINYNHLYNEFLYKTNEIEIWIKLIDYNFIEK